MIVVIHERSAKDKNFGSVQYNDEKIEKGKGELISSKNFPSFIDVTNKEHVKQYLKSIEPKNKKFENVHFHASISCKGREHSKETLKNIADDFMSNLGYSTQPYIVIFHNDSRNNHVHIVSTNVEVASGKQLIHSFTKLKSQEALAKAEQNILGLNNDKLIDNLLSYKFANVSQLQKILSLNNLDSYIDENNLNILKNGNKINSLDLSSLKFNNNLNLERANQIRAILFKYKDLIDNNLYAITDNDSKVKKWNSNLQTELKRKFGFDIVFSFSESKNPFGFILVDNKNKEVFKGSDIADMKNIFNFTDIKIKQPIFDFLENSHFKNDEEKLAAKIYLKSQYDFSCADYLLDNKRKIPYNDFVISKNIVNGYVNGVLKDTVDFNQNFKTVKVGEDYYLINERDNYFFNLDNLLSEKNIKRFESKLNNEINFNSNSSFSNSNYSAQSLTTIKPDNNNLSTILLNAGSIQQSGEDNTTSNYKKRRRKFKR